MSERDFTFKSFGFAGYSETRLDGKNRLIVPSAMRKGLMRDGQDDVVVWCPEPGRLFLFSGEYWASIMQRVFDQEQELGYDKMWGAITQMSEDSHPSKIDSQGRVTLPAIILGKAEIKKDIIIVGTADRITVWNPDAYQEFKTATGAQETIKKLRLYF